MIRFFFHPTPNPMKVALLLEELGLSYEISPIDTFSGQQHSVEYRKINPNGKVPAIIDGDQVVFDSNAILLYLAEKERRFLGGSSDRGQLLSWLMFVATGLGPFSGQCVHFSRVHTQSAYATRRYRGEIERHYTVLNDRLSGGRYLAGEEYTIADMAAWGWVDRAPIVFGGEAPLEAWPAIRRWFELVEERPAVQRVRQLARTPTFKTEFDEVTMRALFPSTQGSIV